MPPGEIIAPPVGDDPSDPPRFHNNFQDCERFLAVGRGHVDIVPKVMVGAGGNGDGKDGMHGNVFSALMALMLASRSGLGEAVAAPAPEAGVTPLRG